MALENVDQFLNDFRIAQTEQGDKFNGAEFSSAYDRGANRNRTQPEPDDSLNRKGFVRETAEALGGGIVDAGELWMRAVRAIDPQGGTEIIRDFATFGLDSIQNFVAKHPSLAPDNQATEGVSRWWQQGVRSLVPSLSAAIPGILGGAVAGPIGATVGGGAVSGAIFGLAEFDKFNEEVEERIQELGLSEDEAVAMRAEARNPAIYSALTEGGLEAAANALQVRTLGKFLPGRKTLKNLIKRPVKDIFKKTSKEAIKTGAKQLALTTPVEVGTEFAQSALETKFRRDIGLTDMDSWGAGIDALGPAFVTNLLFFGAGKSANAAQRWGIRHSLEDAKTDPNKRMKAVRDISNIVRGMEDVNAEGIANKMEAVGASYVASGLSIDINNDLGMETMLNQYRNGLQDGSITGITSKRLENTLKQEMDREDLSIQQRIPSFQMFQGITRINEEQQAIEEVRKEEDKDTVEVEATGADLLEQNAKRATDKLAEVKPTVKVKKEDKKPETTEKDITKKAQKDLVNTGIDATTPNATKDKERETERAKAIKKVEIKKEVPIVEAEPATGKPVTKLPVGLEKSKPKFGAGARGNFDVKFESDVDKALFIVARRDTLSKADDKFVDFLKTEFPNDTDAEIMTRAKGVKKSIGQQIRDDKSLEGEVPFGASEFSKAKAEPIISKKEAVEEETAVGIKIDKRTGVALKAELKDPDSTPQEIADATKALRDAGVEVKDEPTIAVTPERVTPEEGVKITGEAPALAGKLKKGEKRTAGQTKELELTKKIGNALRRLNSPKAKEVRAARKDLKEATLERNQLREDILSGKVKETGVAFESKGVEIVTNQATEAQIVINNPELRIDKDGNAAIGAAALISTAKQEGVRVDKHGIRTVGDSISADMMTKGKVEIIGREVKNERDIATITQMYRNPQYETFRYIFVKGRKVVGHRGVTSRLPGSVQVFAEDKQTEVGKIKTQMAELNADEIYLVHNHPSGNPSPSQADQLFTQGLMKAIPEITSHVIINSGKFSHINKSGGVKTEDIATDDAILQPSVPNDLLGQRMANPKDVVKLGKQLQVEKGYMTALYASVDNKVKGIIEIPLSQVSDAKELAGHLRENAVQLGSQSAVLTVDTGINPEAVKLQEQFVEMIENKIVADVILANGTQTVSMRTTFDIRPLTQERRFIGGEVQTFVEEEKSNFEKDGGKTQTFVDKDFSDLPHVDAVTQDIFNKKLGPKVKGETFGEKWGRWTSNWKLKVQQGVIDQYASLKKLDDRLWKLAQVTTSSSGAVEALLTMGPLKLTEGIPDIVDPKGDKGLFKILKPLGGELELFLGWIAGNRSARLPAGKERNLAEDEITRLVGLDQGKMKDGRSRKSVYRKALRDLNVLHQSVLDIAVETGTINKEEMELWDKDFYLPFFRHVEEVMSNETKGPKTLGGIANQTAFKKLQGKDVPVADMLTNIILNWNHLVGASMKNQVAAKTVKLAAKEVFPDGDPVATKINVDIEVVEDKESGQFKVIDALSGKSRGAFDTHEEAQEHQEQLTRIIEEKLAKASSKTVFVREDGKKVWYEINEPSIYQALTNLNFEGFNNRPMKAMRKFKRMLTFGVTASPDFKIRNLFRDTISSAATSKISLNLFDNVFGTGAKTQFSKDSLSRMRMMAGGGNIMFGHLYGTDPEKLQAQLQKNLRKEGILDNPTALSKLSDKVAGLVDNWNDLGSKLENLNRGALFSQTLEKAEKEGREGFLEANFEARDLLDFNRHGAWPAVRFLIDVVPFMNARIQGLDKLGRSFSDSAQRKRLTAVLGGVAMASMALYLAFKDDDEFKEREEWDRDTYWWFKLPGSELSYRLPKPFEIGVIGTMAERLLEQFVDDEAHGELFAERLKFAITETFALGITPQAIKPVLEIMANKNFFTDRPIETLAMENLSPTDRRKAWTSETAIVLSKGFSHIPWEKVQLSPVQIESLVQGYLGWVGATALGAVDQVFTQPLGGFPGRPSRRIEEVPLIGSFVRTTPSRQTKYSSLFYEGLKEMNQTWADVRNFRTLGETQKAIDLARKEKDTLRFRKLANKIQKNVAAVTKRIRLTRLDKNMSAQEKRAKIDRLTVTKNKLLKMAVKKINP